MFLLDLLQNRDFQNVWSKVKEMDGIKFLVMDVDGTLTDGKIYMGSSGEMFKAFDVKDGCGIKDILPKYEIVPIIITARNSKILKNRCEELAICDVYQGIRDKINKLYEIMSFHNKKDNANYSLKNVAYIGDDILDLQCMLPIKENKGIVACPLDAVEKVVEIADYVCHKKGGDGAVREFIEWLVSRQELVMGK